MQSKWRRYLIPLRQPLVPSSGCGLFHSLPGKGITFLLYLLMISEDDHSRKAPYVQSIHWMQPFVIVKMWDIYCYLFVTTPVHGWKDSIADSFPHRKDVASARGRTTPFSMPHQVSYETKVVEWTRTTPIHWHTFYLSILSISHSSTRASLLTSS